MSENPVRILIVDDNMADVRLLKEALLEECPECVITHLDNGERAIDYLLQRGAYQQSPAPDLVILDLNMPRLDGYEVLKVVRSTPHLSRLTVSVLSSSPHEIARAEVLEPEQYFQKPFELDAFLAVAKDILRQFRATAAATSATDTPAH